jgi:HEPN domain-containing protein
MNRSVFRELAETRLLDAKALFQAERFDAAYYLAGYVVECALKACIARSTREHDFPPKARKVADYYSHDLEKLIRLAAPEFEEDLNGDRILARNWNLVKRWDEESRYELQRASAKKLAEDMLLAISDAEHGVLKCLSKYW